MNRCCESPTEVAWRTEALVCGRTEGQWESATFPELPCIPGTVADTSYTTFLFNGPWNSKVHMRKAWATLPTV